jgi:endo-1,4-beta-xylanase
MCNPPLCPLQRAFGEILRAETKDLGCPVGASCLHLQRRALARRTLVVLPKVGFLFLTGVLLALCAAGWGQEAVSTDAELLKGANARIERYRKTDAKVIVLNARGKPVRDVRVEWVQTRHAFLFGCAALSLLNHKDPAQEALYQKQFGDLFNFATVLTYWQDTDPEPNRQDLEKLTARVDRLNAMHIRVKGHPLILAGAAPGWAPKDPDRVRDLTQQRITDLVSRFRDKIEVWDVVGDATTASGIQNGLGAWARKAGPAQLTTDALTWARAANPHATLLYNDYKLDADYTHLIQEVEKANAPLDVLGLEAHMSGGAEWPLTKVWETAETFRPLKKSLHFSEITVPSDDPKADHSKSWPSTPAGEKRQADYVEKLYTILFSHPSVQGIAWWNFVDGDWDRNPGGLLRADLSPKPAYDRLRHLIHEKWWTPPVSNTTDYTGTAKFRGFAGRYKITVHASKGPITIETDILCDQFNLIKVQVK